MATYYVGTSGWVYQHWRGVLYPQGLPQSKWLDFYAQHFSTVELNNTFYRLPMEQAFRRWHEGSPEGFIYAVKASRFITHIKRLKGIDEAVDTFVSRVRLLGEKLGPLLYQLPPNMRRNDQGLDAFLSHLPQGFRHVVELRHQSWLDDAVLALLRKHKVGLCVFDMPDLQCPLVATAGFAYIRFHGATGLYHSCYSDEELEDWARRIAALGEELDAVYVYFNNDAGGYAVQNARTLAQMLG